MTSELAAIEINAHRMREILRLEGEVSRAERERDAWKTAALNLLSELDERQMHRLFGPGSEPFPSSEVGRRVAVK